MHFVFDFGLQIEVFQKTGYRLSDFVWFAFSFYNFFFDCLFDLPEGVAVFNVFKDQFALFCIW